MTQVSPFVHFAAVAAYVVALVCAAVSDFRTLEIPNWTAATIALAFLPAAWLAGISISGMSVHFATAAVALVVGAVLFARGVFGGGDVKLLASASLWMGLDDIGPYLIVVSLLGGLLAVGVLAVNRIAALRRMLAGLAWVGGERGATQPIPYGVAIALAALIMLPKLSAQTPVLRDGFAAW